MARPDAWVPPADVAFARGVALGLALSALAWGGFILAIWG
jgi:hypothetical protein